MHASTDGRPIRPRRKDNRKETCMTKKHFDNLRDEFDRLRTEEKLQFAVEAMVKTLGDVINKAADTVEREDVAQHVADSMRKMADDIRSSFRKPKRKRRPAR